MKLSAVIIATTNGVTTRLTHVRRAYAEGGLFVVEYGDGTKQMFPVRLLTLVTVTTPKRKAVEWTTTPG